MTHEEAVAVMDQAFGVGAAEAHKLIETDAGVKAVYDSALVALIAVSQAKSPTEMAETPAPQAHVVVKLTEPEERLLVEVLRTNDHHDGFRSYTISGGGSKGSNFRRISLEKRAASLVKKGLLSETPYGFEITPTGRQQLNPPTSNHMMVPPIIGETIENLTQLGKYTHDIETRHIQADDLLCEVIVAMVPGGQRIVDAFKAIRKVYA